MHIALQPLSTRERIRRTLAFDTDLDRLPMLEWAPWWDATTRRWETEGLPAGMDAAQSLQYFGLDELHMLNAAPATHLLPAVPHGAPHITCESEYDAIRPLLYSDERLDAITSQAKALQARHAAGQIGIRIWVDGFFWYPRTLLGIEPHLYAFYDYPELMHRINGDLADFTGKALQRVFDVLVPEFVGFAEDMSYNHGPMLSHALFEEFLLPYYTRVIPMIKQAGTHALVDSDGQVIDMIPWLLQAGLEGVYPLERQAGVDVAAMRAQYPRIILMGGYDKMVMNRGEAAMRAEFERLLPVMAQGGFLVSVDHQTPPGVSLAQYRQYLQLLQEYAHRAVAVR